jgi:hypothetical protein
MFGRAPLEGAKAEVGYEPRQTGHNLVLYICHLRLIMEEEQIIKALISIFNKLNRGLPSYSISKSLF